MGLQVGELFASFEIDTSGVDKALREIERGFAGLEEEVLVPVFAALGRGAAAGFGQTLRSAAEAGRQAARGALSGERGSAIGRDFAAGLASGIRRSLGGVTQAAAAAGRSAAAALRGALDSHSPSRLTAAIGLDFDKGLLQGIRRGQGLISEAAQRLGWETADSLYAALRGAAGTPVPAQGGTAAKGGTEGTAAAAAGISAADLGALIETYARLVATALNGTKVEMDGEEVGVIVAPVVSEIIAANAGARRYGTT